MKRMIIAWINKYILHVKSPSGMRQGYEYEWDMLRRRQKHDR
jgi:hypothetical protein